METSIRSVENFKGKMLNFDVRQRGYAPHGAWGEASGRAPFLQSGIFCPVSGRW